MENETEVKETATPTTSGGQAAKTIKKLSSEENSTYYQMSDKPKKVKKKRKKMTTGKKVILGVVLAAVLITAIYLLYYYVHYVWYDGYSQYLSSYEYEEGTAFTTISEAKSDVRGYALVAENEYLKLYTNTENANVAVYDKRDGSITYSNPQDPDNDSIANGANINLMKSQMIVQYYNTSVTGASLNSYSDCVSKNQFTVENIENGIRYIYTIGTIGATIDSANACFEIPLEYRLEGDTLKVSIPTSEIKESGNGYIYRIQLLRYMGAADTSEEGYIVVPNGSGSLINFNNGKTSASNYSQYIYDIDPMVSTYTQLENTESAKLPIFGICREDRSLLVEVTDGASTALINAYVSGSFNDYNFVFPTFVLRNIDNLKMFGNSTTDVYVMEPNLYDINIEVAYSFLTEENKGYSGLANYYRDKLISEGKLAVADSTDDKDIPLYYDVIAGVKETSHFLGVQYLHTFSMTTFEEAEEIARDLANAGVGNQVLNLQGWFNGGYYHDTVRHIWVTNKLGGKSGIEDLQGTMASLDGRLFVDVAIQEVTAADDNFNYSAEASRYYGAGYVARFGLVNPATLRNTSGLGYTETRYSLLSPKFLPRYTDYLIKNMAKVSTDGISLRDLGNVLSSDKKRTELIDREAALDIVMAQLDKIENTGLDVMTNSANAYSFAYSTDIINAPINHNTVAIVDERIPLYEMIIHGCISYSSELLNNEDADSYEDTVLLLVESGAAPHFVFTWEDSSEMKDTGMNRYYATTYSIWKNDAVDIYSQVNDALKYVTDAQIVNHEIISDDVRVVTYSNGVSIYINYGTENATVDGIIVPAKSYTLEGTN